MGGVIMSKHKCDICKKKFADDRDIYALDAEKVSANSGSDGMFGRFKKKRKIYICSGCIDRIRRIRRNEDVVDKLAAFVYGDIDKRVRRLEDYMGLYDDGK